jgi:hypothetical protein
VRVLWITGEHRELVGAPSLGRGNRLDGREREQLQHAPPHRGLRFARPGTLPLGRSGRQGRGGPGQDRQGDGGFGRFGGGRPHPGADGEEGADGALESTAGATGAAPGGGAVALKGTVERRGRMSSTDRSASTIAGCRAPVISNPIS